MKNLPNRFRGHDKTNLPKDDELSYRLHIFQTNYNTPSQVIGEGKTADAKAVHLMKRGMTGLATLKKRYTAGQGKKPYGKLDNTIGGLQSPITLRAVKVAEPLSEDESKGQFLLLPPGVNFWHPPEDESESGSSESESSESESEADENHPVKRTRFMNTPSGRGEEDGDDDVAAASSLLSGRNLDREDLNASQGAKDDELLNRMLDQSKGSCAKKVQ